MTARVLSWIGRLPGALRRRPGRCAAAAALLAASALGLALAGRQAWAAHRYHAALAALDRRDFDAAAAHLDGCLLVWPTSVEVRLLQARLARQAGAYAEAERRLEQCRRLHGPRDAVSLEEGLLRAQQGELTPELEDTLRARADQGGPDEALVLEALGRGYSRCYRLNDALGCLDRWVGCRPDDVQALLGRGWVHERLRRYEEAEADYRRAVALVPQMEEPALRLAQLLLLLGRQPEEPAALFERLWQGPSHDRAAGVGLAQCWLKTGRADEARRLLAVLAAEAPRDPNVLFERGNLALQQGNPAEAEDLLRRAAALAPHDYQIQYALYQCLQQQGRDAEARAAQERVRALEADLLRIDELTERLQRRPYDPALRCEIGRLFLRGGERHEGELWLKSALLADPHYRPAHQALADYYDQNGEPTLAARHRREAEAAEGPSGG
jgi:Flp pilus assembly protein TadD